MAGGFHIPHAITRNTLAGPVDTRNVSYTEYPMQSEDEATHLLKAAEVCIGMKCFMRKANVPTAGKKWRIFTSEEYYESYVEFKKHKRRFLPREAFSV
ncbi:MAG: hypothetical protein WBV70_00855 [Candidatus Bathyarchaeia archaeon]